MSFLSNFNILVGILSGPTDLLESNEDMIFSVSVLSVGLTKKEALDLFLRKSEKCLCENEIVVPSTVRVLGISVEVFLIFRIDFMPFHVFLMLLQLASK